MPPFAPSEALLVLEDGTAFTGLAVSPGTRFGEVVFNTSMTGYQEILTDPSYRGQIVVMTQPHIGNYGVTPAVAESGRPWVEGFVARRITRRASSHESEENLPDYLSRNGLPAIEGIDTRALVRRLRERGSLKGVVSSERSDVAGLVAELADFPSMAGRALVDEVAGTEVRRLEVPAGRRRTGHLAVYDFGAKANILRSLNRRGMELTILPPHTSAHECLALGVDGVVLSNGPGDPEPLADIVETVRELVASEVPMFGICLGHQLLGLALGGRTFKLKFGHHGGNQPVRDAPTGRVLITSQNHGFAVDPGSLPAGVTVHQTNLNDGTVEGLVVEGRKILSVQYHPEAAPGPHEAASLFDRFLADVAGGDASPQQP